MNSTDRPNLRSVATELVDFAETTHQFGTSATGDAPRQLRMGQASPDQPASAPHRCHLLRHAQALATTATGFESEGRAAALAAAAHQLLINRHTLGQLLDELEPPTTPATVLALLESTQP